MSSTSPTTIHKAMALSFFFYEATYIEFMVCLEVLIRWCVHRRVTIDLHSVFKSTEQCISLVCSAAHSFRLMVVTFTLHYCGHMALSNCFSRVLDY
ncbi:hypothetical protein HanRHA438_Chr03g0098571 [Helianthus annuus]|nr:hypothetical protein HanIR_Chr12g0611631 [Helianthus annuus]KAJ0933649.1 hypothetical protein HanRHA438_Chr03g0098571 [Helianthus annuus]